MAKRVLAIVERYALPISSGDFNEWTCKNATIGFDGSRTIPDAGTLISSTKIFDSAKPPR